MTAAEKDRHQSYLMGYAAALDGDGVPSTDPAEKLEDDARDLFPYLRGEDFRRGLAEAKADLAEDAL